MAIRGVDNFDAIDVDYCIVIVGILQVDCVFGYVFGEIYRTPHPDFAAVPFGLYRRSACVGAEGSLAPEPAAVIEIRFHPFPVWLRLGVSSLPCPLFSCRDKDAEGGLFLSHESVWLPVDFYDSDQGEFIACPMAGYVVIEVIRERPSACVWVDRDQRVSRWAERVGNAFRFCLATP